MNRQAQNQPVSGPGGETNKSETRHCNENRAPNISFTCRELFREEESYIQKKIIRNQTCLHLEHGKTLLSLFVGGTCLNKPKKNVKRAVARNPSLRPFMSDTNPHTYAPLKHRNKTLNISYYWFLKLVPQSSSERLFALTKENEREKKAKHSKT